MLEKEPVRNLVTIIILLVAVGVVLFSQSILFHTKFSPTPASVYTGAPSGLDMTTWKIYSDTKNGFEIKYPPSANVVDPGSDDQFHAGLPVSETGTNLSSKYIAIRAHGVEEVACANPLGAEVSNSQNVQFQGIYFTKEIGQGVGAGQIYDSETYSTIKDKTCINIMFVLHSSNQGMYPPLVPFNHDQEAKIFAEIMDTFKLTR